MQYKPTKKRRNIHLTKSTRNKKKRSKSFMDGRKSYWILCALSTPPPKRCDEIAYQEQEPRKYKMQAIKKIVLKIIFYIACINMTISYYDNRFAALSVSCPLMR